MRHVDRDPAVRALAERLGVRVHSGLAGEIRRVVIDSVERQFADYGIEPRTLDEVLEVTAQLHGMEFVHVEDDSDFDRIESNYGAELPALERQLSFEFRDSTEAVVIRRRPRDPRSGSRYLAVVDARGERANKAWYGARHEAVHVVVPDDANKQMYRKTRAERPEPFEQVIDHIASRLGFWQPIVGPVLQECLRTSADVLDGFERARAALAPRASKEACYRAFAELVREPLLIVWTDVATKKNGDPRTAAQRVRTVIANDAARKTGLFIPENYRVPPHSVMAQSFGAPWAMPARDVDRLDRWTSSSGGRLAAVAVEVVARGRWAAMRLRS
jgi:hypothetical protein